MQCSPAHVHALSNDSALSSLKDLSRFLDVKHRLQTFPTLGNPPPFTSSIPPRPQRQALSALLRGCSPARGSQPQCRRHRRRQQQLGAVLITKSSLFSYFYSYFHELRI